MGLFACILNGKTTLLATGTIDCGLAVDDGRGLTVDFLVALDADDEGTGVDDAGRFTLRALDRRVSLTMCFFCDADRPTHLWCTETVIDTLWTWISSSHANMCARGAKGPWDKRQKQKQHAHKQGVTHTQQPSFITNIVHHRLMTRPMPIQSCRNATSGMSIGSK